LETSDDRRSVKPTAYLNRRHIEPYR